MKIEIKVPEAGESINEAEVGVWLKADGDLVEKGEMLVEFETDKASLEMVASESGVLEILKEVGEVVQVGEVVARIDTEKSKSKSKTESKGKSISMSKEGSNLVSSGKSVEIIVPEAGESINEAEVGVWLKADGDLVEKGEMLVEFETDKASLEMVASESGVLEILKEVGEVVQVGEVVGKIKGGSSPKVLSPTISKEPLQEKVSPNSSLKEDDYAKGYPSGSARRIIEEKGVSTDSIVGTGKGGRITKGDALGYSSGVSPTKDQSFISPKESSFCGCEEEDCFCEESIREPMSSIRKTISNNLIQAKNNTVMLSVFDEVDMSEVFRIQKKYHKSFEDKYAIDLGMIPFFIKAVNLALTGNPMMGAFIDGEEIVYQDCSCISFTVDTPNGSVSPVISCTDILPIDEIQSQVLAYIRKAYEGTFIPSELKGGNFTIVNQGPFGSMLSTPMLNYPQSATLGLHSIKDRPMVVDGEVVIRPMMYLALSYDMRLVDTVEAVEFLNHVKNLVEDPIRLLIDI